MQDLKYLSDEKYRYEEEYEDLESEGGSIVWGMIAILVAYLLLNLFMAA